VLAEDLEHRLDHGAGDDAGADAAQQRTDPEGQQPREPQPARARHDPAPHVLVDLLGDQVREEPSPAAEDGVPAQALAAQRLGDDLRAPLAAEHAEQHEAARAAVGHVDPADVRRGEGEEGAGLREGEPLADGQADRGGGPQAREGRDAADPGAGRGGQRGEAGGDLLEQLPVGRLGVLGPQVLDIGAGQRGLDLERGVDQREPALVELLGEGALLDGEVVRAGVVGDVLRGVRGHLGLRSVGS
jgi:hypothetical protein